MPESTPPQTENNPIKPIVIDTRSEVLQAVQYEDLPASLVAGEGYKTDSAGNLEYDASAPHLGLVSDAKTHYLIMPNDKLRLQAELLFKFLEGSELPKQWKELDPKTQMPLYQKYLFDAAGKAVNLDGETPLHAAIRKGYKEMAVLLIDKLDKEQLSIQDVDLETPLHAAIRKGYKEMAGLLIDKLDKEQLSFQDVDLETPLHAAIIDGRESTIKLLIEKLDREQLILENKNGNTPLQLLINMDNEISRRLIPIISDKLGQKDLEPYNTVTEVANVLRNRHQAEAFKRF